MSLNDDPWKENVLAGSSTVKYTFPNTGMGFRPEGSQAYKCLDGMFARLGKPSLKQVTFYFSGSIRSDAVPSREDFLIRGLIRTCGMGPHDVKYPEYNQCVDIYKWAKSIGGNKLPASLARYNQGYALRNKSSKEILKLIQKNGRLPLIKGYNRRSDRAV